MTCLALLGACKKASDKQLGINAEYNTLKESPDKHAFERTFVAEKKDIRTDQNKVDIEEDRLGDQNYLEDTFKKVLNLKGTGTDRNFAMSDLVAYCNSSGNSSKLLSLVLTTMEESDTRTHIVRMLFNVIETSERLNQKLEMYNTLSSESEKNDAAFSIGSSIGENLDKIDVSNLNKLGKTGEEILLLSIKTNQTSKLEKGNITLRDISMYYDKISDATKNNEGNKNKLVNQMLLYLADSSVKEAWSFIKNDSERMKDINFLNQFVQKSTRSFVYENVDDIVTFPNTVNISPIILAHLNYDPSVFKDWFANKKTSLDKNVVNCANQAFANFASEKNNFTEAWKSVELITDPEIKNQASQQVWVKEKEMVGAAVNKDPEGTLNQFMNGQTQHVPEWAEEGMLVWLGKDFDGANKWYEKNWKTLPKDKAQYVAAAFADRALDADDATTAQQWLGYIQNPQVKERINQAVQEKLKQK